MGYDNRPNLSCKQFDQQGCDYLYLAGHNCVCGTGGTISSNSGYQISGQTIFNATGVGVPSAIRIGHNANNQGESSIAIGFNAQACCMCGVVIGCNNISRSCGGNIIGGFGNVISTGNTNSTLLGVNNCTINADCYTNSVIVPNLVILTSPTGSGGYLCYNASTKKVEQTTGSGSASGERITKLINQASHGFVVGDVVGFSGTTYNKPLANGLYNGEVLGIVSKCYNTSCFDLTQAGFVSGLTGLATNTTYFLSPTTAGQLTATEPSTSSQISKAVLIATSSSSAWVLPYPGYVISTGATTGGSSYTFNNGLTKVGNIVSLGGSLTGNTILNGGNYNLCFGNTTPFNVVSVKANDFNLYSSGSSSYICHDFDLINPRILTYIQDCTGNKFIDGNTNVCGFYTQSYCNSNCNTTIRNSSSNCSTAVAWQTYSTNSGLTYCQDVRINTVGTVYQRFLNTICCKTDTTKNIILNQCFAGRSFNFIMDDVNYLNFDKTRLCSRGKLYASGLTNATKSNVIYYDSATNELTYGTTPGGSGPTFGWSCAVRGSTVAGCGTITGSSTLCNSTYYGVSAGTKTTTGTGNVGIGLCALTSVIIGNSNTAVGTNSLMNNTSSQNTGFGFQALMGNTNGYDNTAVGTVALSANVGGYGNAALGSFALTTNNSGYYNIGVGYQPLFYTSSGHDNTAIGYRALYCNTTGNFNIAIGCEALRCNTSSNNIAIGQQALATNNTGNQNIAVGNTALNANSSGVYNIALGFQTLLSNIDGSCNTAIGLQSMILNTSGNENVALGVNAVYSNTTGCGNIGVGTSALRSNKTGQCNIAVGKDALYNTTGGSCNIGIGSQALYLNTNGWHNIAMGDQALYSNTLGINNIAVGTGALRANIDGQYNTAIGYHALYGNTSGYGNIAMGCNALLENTSGVVNIALGFEALNHNCTGCANIAIGFEAQFFRCSGIYNVALGNQALYGNRTANFNTAVGDCALFSNTGGTSNVALGFYAGFGNIVGSCNVFLGLCAGYNETGSNKLHIANTYNCTLICGDFSAKTVKIDSCLCVTCAIQPASGADAGFPNNSIYYSTTQNRLVYKDSGGTVNVLY